jgi:hypothetical protein
LRWEADSLGSDSLAVISLCGSVQFFATDFFILLVQGINPIIRNRIFHFVTNFLTLLLHRSRLFHFFKLEITFGSKYSVALFRIG